MPQYSLNELASLLDAVAFGDGAVVIKNMAPVAKAKQTDICYVKSSNYLDDALASNAGAILISKQLHRDIKSSHNFLLADNIELVFAKLANLFVTKPQYIAGINEAAAVASTAHVDPAASVAANVVIGENCHIAAGVVIQSGCVLYDDVRIAENSILHANISVYSNSQIGSDCIIHAGVVIGSDGFGNVNNNGRWLKVPQLGGVNIGNDVEIGANTTIDRGALDDTIVEDGVRIDNQVHIGHNVTVGYATAIAGGTVVAGSVTIGANCLIGGGCCISGHLELVDGVILTGMSAVSKSITSAGIYSSGQPAQQNRDWHKSVIHYRNLDKIVKRIKKLESK